MSFKTHLVVVSCIVIAVLLMWQFMLHSNAPVSTTTAIPEKPPAERTYSISVTHASWGVNCRNIILNNDSTREAFLTKSNNKLREDNVLEKISHLCNGRATCTVNIDEPSLGADPSPECNSKLLEIEYRCFTYDRPWSLKTVSTPVTLHCEQPVK